MALFKKGVSGNPKGRPPILSKEVTTLLEGERQSVKVLIVSKLRDKLGPMIDSCIEHCQGTGDVKTLQTLLELSLGKMITDAPVYDISDDEKTLIEEYRKRKTARQMAHGGGEDIPDAPLPKEISPPRVQDIEMIEVKTNEQV